MTAPTITPRQQAILAFVGDYVTRCGHSPSFREVATGVGLASPSTVEYHLHKLAGLGLVELPQRAGQPRSVRLAPEVTA